MTKKEFILANNGTFSGMYYQKGGNWRCRKVINGEMVEMVIKTSYLHNVLGNKPMYNHISNWYYYMKTSKRFFRIGERVYNCNYKDYKNMAFGVISQINGKPENGVILANDKVRLVIGDEIIDTIGDMIYKIAPRISKKVGEIVCYEHHTFERGHNYPFYMPSNDENYYRFELEL